MNLSIISGRMVKDPEVRYTNSGKAVCSFTVAVNDGKDKAQFVPCVAWEKTAETIGKWFDKGSPITLTGHLSCRVWEKDGTKRYAWEVFVDRFEFVPQSQAKKAVPGEFAELMGEDPDLPF